MAALAAFFRSRNLSTDWDAVKQAADANLVTSLSMVLPFGPAEKQALLEAADSDGARQAPDRLPGNERLRPAVRHADPAQPIERPNDAGIRHDH